jgi:transcriptional regulator with XRE-family HTH domain
MFAMLKKELQVEIDVLHRQGKGIREIARETGIARNTVRAILRGEHSDSYGPREPRPTKIAPHAEYLRERLEFAGKTQLPATVLLRELRAQGYDGGITQLKDFLRSLRPAIEPEPNREGVDNEPSHRQAETGMEQSSKRLGRSMLLHVEQPRCKIHTLRQKRLKSRMESLPIG